MCRGEAIRTGLILAQGAPGRLKTPRPIASLYREWLLDPGSELSANALQAGVVIDKGEAGQHNVDEAPPFQALCHAG